VSMPTFDEWKKQQALLPPKEPDLRGRMMNRANSFKAGDRRYQVVEFPEGGTAIWGMELIMPMSDERWLVETFTGDENVIESVNPNDIYEHYHKTWDSAVAEERLINAKKEGAS
jgi:hypothetical protein